MPAIYPRIPSLPPIRDVLPPSRGDQALATPSLFQRLAERVRGASRFSDEVDTAFSLYTTVLIPFKLALVHKNISPLIAMNTSALKVSWFVILTASLALGEEPASGSAVKAPTTAATIPGWGEIVDLAKDCHFTTRDKELVVTVPGTSRPHDFSTELGNIDAPRVLLTKNGDFTIEVKIDGNFSPGAKSTQPSRTPYMGAGLVVMADDRNYILLNLASLQGVSTQGPVSYINFEIRTNGKITSFGSTRDFKTPKPGPVWLRIERKGGLVHGAVRQEGEDWANLTSKVLPETWPKVLKAGINAVSTSTLAFSPKFSDLKVTDRAEATPE